MKAARWYAVYTKPNGESIAEENLERQGYLVYLPRLKQARRRRGRWVGVVEPLFPRYLFVRLAMERDNIAPIRSTKGVTGLVRFGREPAPVPDGFVESLQAAADEESGCQVIDCTLFKKGDEIRILDGPFAGYNAVFEGANGEERVIILLNLMGRESAITVSRHQIAPAS